MNLNKRKLASVLAPLAAMFVILTVGAFSIVAGEPLGSTRTVAAEIPLGITIAAALTLVTVDLMIVLRRRRQTRTKNRNQYTPQQVNAGVLPWQGGLAAFAAVYCDQCGNRLSRVYQDSMAVPYRVS